MKNKLFSRAFFAPAIVLVSMLSIGLQRKADAQLPSGWTTTLLGTQTTGNATYNSGTSAFTVNGVGRPFAQFDGGTFVYKQVTGNFDFKVRVTGYTKPYNATQANLLAMNTPASYQRPVIDV